jgi:hypothetical protein
MMVDRGTKGDFEKEDSLKLYDYEKVSQVPTYYYKSL